MSEIDSTRRITDSMGAGSRLLDALHLAHDVEEAERLRLRRAGRVQRFLAGATGFGFAWTSRFIENLLILPASSLLPTAVIPLAGLATVLWLYHRRRGDRRSYQFDNAVIWAGFTLGWTILAPGPSMSPLAGAIGWSACAAAGALLSPAKRADGPIETRDE